jgi:hypothetical protein
MGLPIVRYMVPNKRPLGLCLNRRIHVISTWLPPFDAVAVISQLEPFGS